jgi:hypothetical protein
LAYLLVLETYEFADDNINLYKSIMMDTMRINQDYLGKGSRNIILDEEPNVDATRVSKLFKRFC